MNLSRQLALRLRQSVQGCTLHLHGPVQAWAAVERACTEGSANRQQVAQYVIDSCTGRINELVTNGVAPDDQRILKEQKTRSFVQHLLLGGKEPLISRSPLLQAGAIIINDANEREIVLIKGNNTRCRWELPACMAETGETVEKTAQCHVQEVTNLQLENLKLLGVFSYPAYDAEQHTVTVVFTATGRGTLRAKDDAYAVNFFPLANLPELASEHVEILAGFCKSKLNNELSIA